MHILICGASGHVGSAMAKILSTRHRVTGLVRRPPTDSVAYHPVVVPNWINDPDTVIAALAEGVSLGPVDAVVAALGGWTVGDEMLSHDSGSFESDFASYLLSHFAAARITRAIDRHNQLHYAGTGGSQTVHPTHLALNGVASIEPLKGSGAISVFGAAQRMLIRVAAAESSEVPFRELTILAPIAGDDRNDLSGGVPTVSIGEVTAAAEDILHRPEAHDIGTELRPKP